MASRHCIFADDGFEIPPPRRPPPAARGFPPGVPPADGQDPPEGWTPIRMQLPHVPEPDGTPSTGILYSRPCAAHQHHWPDTTTVEDWRYDGRRWSPEPLQVEGATRVVRLAGMLSLDELRDEEFYQDVVESVREEACKFGDLANIVVPRPGAVADPVIPGAGKVFLEYACLDHSIRAWEGMDGRWFATRQIVARFYPEDKFAATDYGYDAGQ